MIHLFIGVDGAQVSTTKDGRHTQLPEKSHSSFFTNGISAGWFSATDDYEILDWGRNPIQEVLQKLYQASGSEVEIHVDEDRENSGLDEEAWKAFVEYGIRTGWFVNGASDKHIKFAKAPEMPNPSHPKPEEPVEVKNDPDALKTDSDKKLEELDEEEQELAKKLEELQARRSEIALQKQEAAAARKRERLETALSVFRALEPDNQDAFVDSLSPSELQNLGLKKLKRRPTRRRRRS